MRPCIVMLVASMSLFCLHAYKGLFSSVLPGLLPAERSVCLVLQGLKVMRAMALPSVRKGASSMVLFGSLFSLILSYIDQPATECQPHNCELLNAPSPELAMNDLLM